MRRPSPLPPELGSAFTVSAALDAGVSRDRMRAGDLTRHFTGARAVSMPAWSDGPARRADLIQALKPLLRPDQHFSHLTAAELHGMRMPEGFRRTELHVSYRHAHRAMRRPDVVGHKTKMPVTVDELPDGIRASAPVDAWCENASILTVDDLVIMGDGLIQRRHPVATLEELERAVMRRPGRRGAARLRRALPQLRARTDSARETILRLIVVRAGFPEPEVNGELVDRHGRVFAHGDLVWPEYRVVLEYEGRHHAEDARQFGIDIQRLNAIAAADYRTVRIDRVLLADRFGLLSAIANALAARGWRGSPSRGRYWGE